MKRTEKLRKILEEKGYKGQVYYSSVSYDTQGYYFKSDGMEKPRKLGYNFNEALALVTALKPKQ